MECPCFFPPEYGFEFYGFGHFFAPVSGRIPDYQGTLPGCTIKVCFPSLLHTRNIRGDPNTRSFGMKKEGRFHQTCRKIFAFHSRFLTLKSVIACPLLVQFCFSTSFIPPATRKSSPAGSHALPGPPYPLRVHPGPASFPGVCQADPLTVP